MMKEGTNDVIVLNPAFDFWRNDEEDIYERYRDEILEEEKRESETRRNLSNKGRLS